MKEWRANSFRPCDLRVDIEDIGENVKVTITHMPSGKQVSETVTRKTSMMALRAHLLDVLDDLVEPPE